MILYGVKQKVNDLKLLILLGPCILNEHGKWHNFLTDLIFEEGTAEITRPHVYQQNKHNQEYLKRYNDHLKRRQNNIQFLKDHSIAMVMTNQSLCHGFGAYCLSEVRIFFKF
jgi:hypothetical protein